MAGCKGLEVAIWQDKELEVAIWQGEGLEVAMLARVRD